MLIQVMFVVHCSSMTLFGSCKSIFRDDLVLAFLMALASDENSFAVPASSIPVVVALINFMAVWLLFCDGITRCSDT